MDRILFWFTVLGTLSIFRILVESENEEILRQQTPDDDGILYRSKNIMQLIMNPKNSNAPCDLQLKICGIDMCVSETIGNSEYVEISSKSSVTDTNKKQVSRGAKKCFCSNNEPVLFVTQEVADKHFAEYRVQEVSESDGISVVCDWKLNIFTRIPNEAGGNPDLMRCISRNKCMVICHVRRCKLLEDADNFTRAVLAIMVLAAIMPVFFYLIVKYYMRTPRAPDVRYRSQHFLTVDEAFNLMRQYQAYRHYRLPRMNRNHFRPRRRR